MTKFELYLPRISDDLQKTLFILCCGGFCGFVFGIFVGVVIL